jgi:hypothetical protein
MSLLLYLSQQMFYIDCVCHMASDTQLNVRSLLPIVSALECFSFPFCYGSWSVVSDMTTLNSLRRNLLYTSAVLGQCIVQIYRARLKSTDNSWHQINITERRKYVHVNLCPQNKCLCVIAKRIHL